MIVSHESNVKEISINNDEVKNVLKKTLINPENGWEGYALRIFEMSNGNTPKHTHPWPHINYILEGRGILHLDGEDHELRAGSFAYVPSNKLHQFRSAGDEPFKFICIVPEEGDK